VYLKSAGETTPKYVFPSAPPYPYCVGVDPGFGVPPYFVNASEKTRNPDEPVSKMTGNGADPPTEIMIVGF
jgi:hypothetical protein